MHALNPLSAIARSLLILGFVMPAALYAHDGHEQHQPSPSLQPQSQQSQAKQSLAQSSAAAPLAISVAFDVEGNLWRVRVKDGYVLADKSNDLGRSFSMPTKLNAEPQAIGTDGDARPKLAIGKQGNIYVSWTQALPKPYTGYIWFAASTDGGVSFTPAVIVHQDRAEITHRFDALAVAPTGRIYLAWVDKRDLVAAKSANKPYEGAAIYYAVSDDNGSSFQQERKLADSSCECCRIALATESNGDAVALWRHVFTGGIRDHAMARFNGTERSAEIHRASFGGWKIDACPHHGPAMAQGGNGAHAWGWHMAWFDGSTGIDGNGRRKQPGLFYARMDHVAWVSSPARRFGEASSQAGHPALLSISKESSTSKRNDIIKQNANDHTITELVWLAWKELTEEGSVIKLVTSADGGRTWNETRQVAQATGASDYPQLLQNSKPVQADSQAGDAVFLAWNTAQHGLRLIKLDAP